MPTRNSQNTATPPARPAKQPNAKQHPAPDAHQGAVETDVTSVTPPAATSPAQVRPRKTAEQIDPADELTPG